MTGRLVRYGPLAAIALVGWWLRLGPLLGAGPFGFPMDYDEGVYFSASALLARGALPYRDFVFVHPPGWSVLLLPLAGPVAGAIGIETAFAAGRVLATVIGAVNITLVGVLSRRLSGPVGALVAASLYATYPEVVGVERGTFLEPVLNLLVLTAGLLWLRTPHGRALAAGLVIGLACLVKTWAAFAVAGLLASVPVTSAAVARRAVVRLALGAAVVTTLVLGPFVLADPRSAFDQIVTFQLQRAPDGLADAGARLRLLFEPMAVRNAPQLLAATHVVSSAGAVVGAVIALGRAWRREARAERFLLVLLATTVGAFLVGRSYYTQYHAHLAVPETLLAGYAAGRSWTALRAEWVVARWLRPVLAAGLVLTPVLPARQSVLFGRARTADLQQLARAVDGLVPDDACLFAFEPHWGLVAGRLPPRVEGLPVIADPYATMLLPTALRGDEFEGIGPAFEVPVAQVRVRRLLSGCDWVVYGGRGPAQLSAVEEAWFTRAYVRRAPPPGRPGLDLWERVSG